MEAGACSLPSREHTKWIRGFVEAGTNTKGKSFKNNLQEAMEEKDSVEDVEAVLDTSKTKRAAKNQIKELENGARVDQKQTAGGQDAVSVHAKVRCTFVTCPLAMGTSHCVNVTLCHSFGK